MFFITPKVVAAATIVGMVLAGGTIGAAGVERVLDERSAAETLRRNVHVSLLSVQHQVDLIEEQFLSLEQFAQHAIAEASGKTFDGTAAATLTASLDAARIELPSIREQLAAITATVSEADANFDGLLIWPPSAIERYRSLDTALNLTQLSQSITAIHGGIRLLATARGTWQAAQDRILAESAAAEAAAAAAAAARAAARASASSVSASGGDTAPTSPVLPDQPAPASADAIVAYLATLEPRAPVTWDPNLCQPDTICGITQLGGPNPVIVLDTDLRDYYLTPTGKYVLVHEAAHARSWYRYGSIQNLSDASIAVTGILPGNPGEIGRAAIEWMADCATIVKLGYSLGAYTATCTPPQLTEAASYW